MSEIKVYVSETLTKKAATDLAEDVANYRNETETQIALSKYLEAIKADYRKWGEGDRKKMSDQEWVESVQYKMQQEFEAGLHVVETQFYYRIHSKTFCHSFIVKQDGPKFKRGDILKSAGYNTPAKNQARGNIFGAYRIRWTGAEYLR